MNWRKKLKQLNYKRALAWLIVHAVGLYALYSVLSFFTEEPAYMALKVVFAYYMVKAFFWAWEEYYG